MKDTPLHEEPEHIVEPNKMIDNTTNRYNRLYQVVSWCGSNPSIEQLNEIVEIVKQDFINNNPNIY